LLVDGSIRDLSAYTSDITAETVAPASLAKLAALDPAALPRVAGSPRFGTPVKGIGKFIAIGLNYADHAKEADLSVPKEPPMFTKAISCLSGPNDDVMLPRDARKGDWEVELGVIIGRTTRAAAARHRLASPRRRRIALRKLPQASSAATATKTQQPTRSVNDARWRALVHQKPPAGCG
jgi:2-keto-4-pentenoate hydratase/2-oxohepta-3-ene-1,7-dioic acid hydratase in catechol pathway